MVVLSTVLVCHGRAIHRRTLLLLQSMFMLGCSILVSPLGSDPAFFLIVLSPGLKVGTLFIALIGLEIRVAVLTTACFHLCSLWSFTRLPPALHGEVSMQAVAVSEVVVMSAKLALLWVVQSSLERSALREVEARLGKCQSSAVSSLLGLVCDAVVDADPALNLASENDSLKSLLMHGEGRKLSGVSLKSFVVDVDGVPSFEASIGRSAMFLSLGQPFAHNSDQRGGGRQEASPGKLISFGPSRRPPPSCF